MENTFYNQSRKVKSSIKRQKKGIRIYKIFYFYVNKK